MQKFYKNKKIGMTLLEILFTVAIVGILIAVVLPQFGNMKENQALKNGVEDIVSALHQAQSESLASENLSGYGVHFQSDQVVIFEGTTFTDGAVGNNVIKIISPAQISSITINSASVSSGDIYFNRLSGNISNTGTNTIVVSTPSYSESITVSPSGTVNVN
jgi:Tfp pilus assembly protein FimT